MVKLIIGGTGSGKTKELIDQVNAAVKEEKGSVVCISRGNKLTFDISHDARLIDAADYPVSDIAGLLGFVGGLRFAQRGAGVCYRRHEAFPVILKRKYISQAQKSNDESRCFFLLPAAGLVRKNNEKCCVFFPL